MNQLVDSHCHLPLIEQEADRPALDGIFARAAELGVGHFLCVSVDLDSFPRILELARTHPAVYASVGVHPNTRTEHEPGVDDLVELARDPAVVAIGETGLDYFRSEGDLRWQHDRFRTHIAAAKVAGKPLIIHTRDARTDVLRVLREESAHEVGGVMHCFVEDYETARAAIDLGFYISFSGIVTFKNASEVQDVARRIPLEWMLVETDSPYLAPVPYRGKTNQPAYVRYVADFIAQLRGLAPEAVAEATTVNFFRLFRSACPVR